MKYPPQDPGLMYLSDRITGCKCLARIIYFLVKVISFLKQWYCTSLQSDRQEQCT